MLIHSLHISNPYLTLIRVFYFTTKRAVEIPTGPIDLESILYRLQSTLNSSMEAHKSRMNHPECIIRVFLMIISKSIGPVGFSAARFVVSGTEQKSTSVFLPLPTPDHKEKWKCYTTLYVSSML